MNDTENNTEKVRLENNATTQFSDSYHNRENIDIFYNLYEKEKYNNPICINTDKWSQGNDSKDNFINRINDLVIQTYSFTPVLGIIRQVFLNIMQYCISNFYCLITIIHFLIILVNLFIQDIIIKLIFGISKLIFKH